MNELLDDDDFLPAEKPDPVPFSKTIKINLGIMLLYMLLSSISLDELGSLFFDGFALAIQISINFLIGLVLLFSSSTRNIGIAMLLSAFLVGIIGFGVYICKISISGNL